MPAAVISTLSVYNININNKLLNKLIINKIRKPELKINSSSLYIYRDCNSSTIDNNEKYMRLARTTFNIIVVDDHLYYVPSLTCLITIKDLSNPCETLGKMRGLSFPCSNATPIKFTSTPLHSYKKSNI